MMGKRKANSSPETATILTLLGRDTVIEGDLTFKETIRVDGRIKGRLQSAEGTVIIGEHAVLDADVKVAVAIIRGTVNGRVEASRSIEVHAPAQIKGDIAAPTVAIDSGVVFNGNCIMLDSGVKPAAPPAPAPKAPSDKVDDAADDDKDTKKFDNPKA